MLNIIYLHAHDAGRFVEPYGYPVQTPNLQALAQDGVLFRKAYCAAPTCGPSRSALLTGSYPHQHGMWGLPGRQGWHIDDYGKHLVQHLNKAGYQTALSGVQHEAPHNDFSSIGYHRILEAEAPAHTSLGEFQQDSIDRVERFLAEDHDDRPFFLSVGIDEPHRDNFPRPSLGLHGQSDRFSKTRFYDPEKLDWRYTAPPPWLPDLPEIRKDMEAYRYGVRLMDEYMGRVIEAVEQFGHRDNTLIIATTDHGIEFPGGKKTLSDQGIGVFLILRGPPGSAFEGGQVIEPMVSQLDLLPTLFDLLHQATPSHCEGRSLLPLVTGKAESLHEAIFAEQTYHGQLEPLRCIRTERYKYIRRSEPSGPNMRHDGPSSRVMESLGHYGRNLGPEQLYDCYLDPLENHNRIDDPDLADVREDLSDRLDAWMEATEDRFESGAFPLPANA